MSSPKPTPEWEPSESDIEWCRNLLNVIADGGMWITSNGTYVVDHKSKTITLILRGACWFEQGLHDRNTKAFAKVGYRVM
jgi:hypothetical protein